ncbi:MAG TPA: carbon-nitrogen hydrolase [Candidatus Paceibacterota bacterium]|nr:carbon-nitrogen hydrolase [Candidatus Paceibacterota bacterium]HPT18149.1 carbon-nitrogen hydrolase [Candidatus Paceibacterota bacterium]
MKNKFVTVAGVQSVVSDDLKENLINTFQMVEDAARNGAQIICLQELYKTPYFPQYKNVKKEKFYETIPGESTDVFSRIARKYKVVIIVPIFEKDKNGRYHNSAAVINIDGKLLPTYRKIHIPQDPLFYEKDYFTESKEGYKIYKTKYATFAVLICYDQWFPEAARSVKIAGADIIFYPTAIGTIKGVKEKEGDWHDAWETIMRGHAIANSLHIVAVNRIGIENKLKFWGQSFICDSFGKIIKKAGDNNDETIIAKIDLASNKIIGSEWGFMKNRRTDTYSSITKKNK